MFEQTQKSLIYQYEENLKTFFLIPKSVVAQTPELIASNMFNSYASAIMHTLGCRNRPIRKRIRKMFCVISKRYNARLVHFLNGCLLYGETLHDLGALENTEWLFKSP